MFRDRNDAGEQLARVLKKYGEEDAVVIALPRGGVVVGERIARALGLPLDICAVRKIGHPNNQEYALCAVDEHGTMLCDEAATPVDPAWISSERQKQAEEAKRRASLYRGGRMARSLKNKIAIIVDDGIATGLTMRLAVQVVKEQKPLRIVAAVPVAPEDSVRSLKKEADEIIVLESPAEFLGAVGAHYERFEQVGDAEVIRLLESAL